MKRAAYIFGLFCVAAGIAFATYFPYLFAAQFVSKFVPAKAEKIFLYLFLAVPVVLALLYLVRTISKTKVYGIPEAFKGWRYMLTVIGFIVLILGAIPIVISLVFKPATGGMSGVPLALGIIFSFILVLPAMAIPKK